MLLRCSEKGVNSRLSLFKLNFLMIFPKNKFTVLMTKQKFEDNGSSYQLENVNEVIRYYYYLAKIQRVRK